MKKIWNGIVNFFTTNYVIKILISFFLGVLMIIFGQIIYPKYDTFFTILTLLSFSYITIITVVGIVYGWFINIIKDQRKLFKTIRIKKGKHYPNIFSRIRIPIFYR